MPAVDAQTRADAPASPLDIAWAACAFLVPLRSSSLFSRMGAIDLAYHVRAGEDVPQGTSHGSDTLDVHRAGHALARPAMARPGCLRAHPRGRAAGRHARAWAGTARSGRRFVLARRTSPPAPPAPRAHRSLLALGGFVVSLAGARDAPATPRAAAVRGAVVGDGRTKAASRPLWLAPRLAALVRQHARRASRCSRVVVGLAWLEDRRRHDRSSPPDPGYRRRSPASRRSSNPFGPRVWTLRVRPVDQSGDPRRRSPSGRH